MQPLSFITANFIARESHYRLPEPVTEVWGKAYGAMQAHFRPAETFPARFGALLDEIADLGFTHLDLYVGHLNPAWASAAHIEAAREALAKRNLGVVSLAGGFGSTLSELRQSCALAHAIGAKILGGGCGLLDTDREGLAATLEEFDLVFAFENHPNEKSASDILAKIGDEHPRIGVAFDTGWAGTNGFDAAQAVRELGGRIKLVHLKDVMESGQHRTCALGAGCVGIEQVLQALQEIGYTGALALEHEPPDRDPRPEVKESLGKLKIWLGR